MKLSIQVPQDSENATWKLEGQILNVEVDIKDTVRTLKQKLMVRVLDMLSPSCTQITQLAIFV